MGHTLVSMALNPHLSTASRNLSLNAALDVLNGGGFLRIYSGTQPANANAALSGNTLLAELSLSSTAFAAASSGSKTANTITADSDANATGTASFATLVLSDGTTRVMDLSVGVGTAGVDFDVAVPTVSVVQHATFSVTSLVISQAA